MFRFEHIDYLYALLLVPLVAALVYLGRRAYLTQRARLGDQRLIEGLSDQQSKRSFRSAFLLTLLALICLVLAAANPQWGAKRQKVKARSSDIFLALDISTSMYCEDIAPNRLEQARRFAQELIDELKGERIGLILFAGNAYLQMPLTTDYAAAHLFLRSASPELAGTQGTALQDVFETAIDNFASEDKFQKTLILISDGEDHDAESLAFAERLIEEGIILFTVGVGTSEGGFIPIQVQGRSDWKRGPDGKPVQTRLNESLLGELSKQAQGQYFRLRGSTDIFRVIKSRVDQMEKREFEERSFTEYRSYYQYFLCLGMLSLLGLWILQSDFIVTIKSWTNTL